MKSAKITKKSGKSRRVRVEPTPTAERLLRKGTRALEAAFDAVAEDPEKALQAGGAFLNRVLETLENAQKAYQEDPEGTREEVKHIAIGLLRKKKRRLR